MIAAIMAAIAISSTLSYEVITIPANPIPRGNIPYVNLTTLQGCNYTLAPVEFNESGKGFSATFELRSGGPILVYPGKGSDVYVGISYTSNTDSTPYTGVAFYINQASFSP